MFESQEDPEINALKNLGKSTIGVIKRTVSKFGSSIYKSVAHKVSSNNNKVGLKEKQETEKDAKKQIKLAESIVNDKKKTTLKKNISSKRISSTTKGKLSTNSKMVKPSFKEKKQEAIIRASKQNNNVVKELGDKVKQIKVKSPSLTR